MFGHIGPNEQKGVISHDITFFEVASLQNGLSVNEKTDAVLWIFVKNFFRNLSKWVRGPEDSKFTMCQLVCCNLILLMLVYRHNVTRAECIRFWPWCYWSTLIQHLYWAALVTVCCWLSVWYHCVSGWKITPITLQIAIHTENIEG